jgi:SNF2 family DNA or RNA helicase
MWIRTGRLGKLSLSFQQLNGCFDLFRYQNTLSGQSQLEPPPEFKGGCLADCMGLGKTLSMLSLIAANPFRAEDLETGGGVLVQESAQLVKATLIVVPFSRKT